MQMIQDDPVLMEEMKAILVAEALGPTRAKQAAVDAAITRMAAASLEALRQNCNRSDMDRIAYDTALAAVAGAGEHTCDPADPCDPANRCDAAEPRNGATLAKRAERLGVSFATFREAHIRMHNTNHSVPPEQALEEGCYLWARRKLTRSDATDRRVLDKGKKFWHSDDVSRATEILQAILEVYMISCTCVALYINVLTAVLYDVQ